MSIGIFYGTTTGVTEDISNRVAERLEDAEVFDVANGIDNIEEFDSLILGTSTWGLGDLQDDWETVIDELKEKNLNGKKVALIGTGDQLAFDDDFVDAVILLKNAVEKAGATVIGYTSTDGYDFTSSDSIIDGKFCGLMIDELNQPDITDDRIDAWVEQLRDEL